MANPGPGLSGKKKNPDPVYKYLFRTRIQLTGAAVLKIACPRTNPKTIHRNNSTEYVIAT